MTIVVPEQPSTAVRDPRTDSPNRVRVGRRVTTVVSVLGAVVLSFVAFLTVIGGIDYSRGQHQLYQELRAELATATAPIAAPIALGRPVALLRIGRLRLRTVVVQGSSARELQRGPGHRVDTPLPGQPGTATILGRRATFGAPFADVATLRAGDVIDVTTGQGNFTYVVDASWRSDRAHDAPAAAASRLELVTSDPSFTPSRTLVVSAHLRGTPAAAGAVGVVQSHGSALTGDPDAATTAYLWAQGLVILALGVTRYRRRLPHGVTWLAAAPLGLVLLWNVFDNLAALLPNTL